MMPVTWLSSSIPWPPHMSSSVALGCHSCASNEGKVTVRAGMEIFSGDTCDFLRLSIETMDPKEMELPQVSTVGEGKA